MVYGVWCMVYGCVVYGCVACRLMDGCGWVSVYGCVDVLTHGCVSAWLYGCMCVVVYEGMGPWCVGYWLRESISTIVDRTLPGQHGR